GYDMHSIHLCTSCIRRPFFFSLLRIPRPPTSTLFPYTTLFRSAETNASPRPEPGRLLHGGKRWIGRTWSTRAQSAKTRCKSRPRSEEHTSELQSRFDLVCRLLLEKKNTYSGY